MPEEPGNQTPDTPTVSETELRAKKVDELRREASTAGVPGSSSMKKDELVHAVADARVEGHADGGQRSGGGGRAGERSGEEPGNQTPNTPEVSETELRGMKVDELRREASGAGVSGTSSMKKDELVHAVADARSAQTDGGGQEPAGSGGEDAGPDGGHLRTGPDTSKSLKYSQEVTSTDEDPERPGRSLATTHHDVIREWAEARNGTPATVPGTEHGDHLGVLRLDFGDDDDRLRHVSWDEWFATFDERRLNFIYQEERTDGHTSTFFRLESPDREDA